MTSSNFKFVSVFSMALVMVMGLADTSEAQRRRRRRRPTPPPAEEPAEVPEEPAADGSEPGEPGPNPFDGDAVADAPGESSETPETPAEPPTEAAVEPALDPAPDLGPLRAELAELMDELVQTRSRVAVLGAQLFQTKVRVRVENRADDQVLSNFTLRLDGAPIFEADGSISDEGRQVFEGFAAPGPHELTVEAEQRARADDDYRYTQRDRYRFMVRQGALTEIIITLDDDSNLADDFADDGEGEYDVRTRVRVATRELGDE